MLPHSSPYPRYRNVANQPDFVRGTIAGLNEGFADGKAEGMAEAVLELLAERGVTVWDNYRQGILASTDLDQLRRWLRRAARCESADELFVIEPERRALMASHDRGYDPGRFPIEGITGERVIAFRGAVGGNTTDSAVGRHSAIQERMAARDRAPLDHLAPSLDHEQIIQLFRNRPALAPELLRVAHDVALPAYTEVRLASADFSDSAPADRRSDRVVLFADGEPVFGIVVAVQLDRDHDKLFTWPVDVTGLSARIRRPSALLVVCTSNSVAQWATKPIDLGFDSFVVPLVVGPGGVPVVTDPEAPVELLVLSAITYGRANDVETAVAVGLAAAEATQRIDSDRRELYSKLILTALSDSAGKIISLRLPGFHCRS